MTDPATAVAPEEAYLILHKVRGQPAFDIAIQVRIGNVDGWIIPTSGHRAYPYQTWKLNDLKDRYDPVCGLGEMPMPEALADHYTVTKAKPRLIADRETDKLKLEDLDL